MTQVKIFKELWRISTDARNLAYLCQKTSDAGFKGRQRTGTNWAKRNSKGGTLELIEETFNNEPMVGFELGEDVSRWSTSNKFIRVKDPRGFEVEISISCLSTLIGDVTIEKGVIKDKCLWARLGPENILISENSEECKNAIKLDSSGKQKFIPMKKIEIGNIVRMSSGTSTRDVIYIGRKKFKCKVKNQTRHKGISLLSTEISKPVYCFRDLVRGMYNIIHTPSTPKIVEILDANTDKNMVHYDDIKIEEYSNYSIRGTKTKNVYNCKIIEVINC